MIRRPDRSSEAGVSLVLVLVTLVVFGLLVPVLGQFGTTNGISGYIVKGQRYDRYAADNGVQSAIAYAGSRRTAGRAHVPCPDLTSTMNATSTAFKRDVTVKCQGFDGSGIPLGSGDIPAYAVLGLNGGQHSIDVNSPGRIKTQGAWWANGDPGSTSADIHQVTIDASDDLFGATGGCKESNNARIFAAPLRCDTGETVGDPNYGSALATLNGAQADAPAPRDACRSVDGNGVVALASGIHWNVEWLNKLTDGSCGRDVVIWLKPGTHYFDFDFYDRGLRGSGDSRWTIGDSGSRHVTVVAGARTWTTEPEAFAAATQANEATAAGACDLGARGAEIVLGSNSNIRVESPARMELCPLAVEGGGQRLAVTGPKSGQPETVNSFGPRAPSSAVGSRISWPDSPPASIDPITVTNCDRNPDCGPAGTNFAEGDLTRDATVTMKIPNPFTANARLESLQLDVSHRESENRGSSDNEGNRIRIRRMWFEIQGLGEMIRCDDLPASGGWSQRTVSCDVSGVKIPMPPAAGPDGLAALDVVLHVETNRRNQGSITLALDHVALKGTQTPAVIRAQGCGCDALNFDNHGHGNNGSAFVWGTVYLPNAGVNADLGERRAFRLARGVVADTFTLEGLPTGGGAPFIPVSLPGGGIYSERNVTFEAIVDGTTKLRARVTFPDPVGQPDAFPRITAWDTHP
ncbi:MAG: hypothetical protein JJE46_00075 [Acidimicrobiia bacterium]|nr:hypothetical protein [Acidimicrobiia bacterium]